MRVGFLRVRLKPAVRPFLNFGREGARARRDRVRAREAISAITARAGGIFGDVAVTATPEQIARHTRRAAQGLGALALLSAVSGGALLIADAAGLMGGALPEASWLVGCGLISGGLTAVSAGLSRAATGMVRAADHPSADLVTLHRRTGETLGVPSTSSSHIALGAETLAGQGLFDRIHVMDRPAFLSALSACANEGREGVVALRLAHQRPGAAPAFTGFEAHVSPAPDGCIRIRWHDTAQPAVDTDDAAARVEAERANDAKTRFLRAMSHELRTPLNSILGFSELLTEDVGQMDVARRADYARIIHQSGQHLLGLVNGILDLSRVEAGAYDLCCEEIDVPALVSGCVEMMALEAERRGVRLVADLSHHLPPLSADQRAVRQILLNLLSNAVKFTPPGGLVELTAVMQGGALVLKVRDTGVGMSSADAARIGEPFFQAGDMDQRRAGIGLGVAVVRALVELHRGAFDVASVLGVGTTATVTLPLCGAAAAVTTIRRPAFAGASAPADRRRA